MRRLLAPRERPCSTTGTYPTPNGSAIPEIGEGARTGIGGGQTGGRGGLADYNSRCAVQYKAVMAMAGVVLALMFRNRAIEVQAEAYRDAWFEGG